MFKFIYISKSVDCCFPFSACWNYISLNVSHNAWSPHSQDKKMLPALMKENHCAQSRCLVLRTVDCFPAFAMCSFGVFQEFILLCCASVPHVWNRKNIQQHDIGKFTILFCDSNTLKINKEYIPFPWEKKTYKHTSSTASFLHMGIRTVFINWKEWETLFITL